MKNLTIIDIMQGLANGTIKNGDLYVDDTMDNFIVVDNNDLYFSYDGDMVKVQVYQVIDLIENDTIFSKYN